mmetsp:Transcript_107368/g.302133  ORF Transcript_107368/g.302133 Transcript_107368/m.302133 type:complete len:511 (+) Transcript_107368:477-2009(+)
MSATRTAAATAAEAAALADASRAIAAAVAVATAADAAAAADARRSSKDLASVQACAHGDALAEATSPGSALACGGVSTAETRASDRACGVVGPGGAHGAVAESASSVSAMGSSAAGSDPARDSSGAAEASTDDGTSCDVDADADATTSGVVAGAVAEACEAKATDRFGCCTPATVNPTGDVLQRSCCLRFGCGFASPVPAASVGSGGPSFGQGATAPSTFRPTPAASASAVAFSSRRGSCGSSCSEPKGGQLTRSVIKVSALSPPARSPSVLLRNSLVDAAGMDTRRDTRVLPTEKCCHRPGFLSISAHVDKKASTKELMWANKSSQGGTCFEAFSDTEKNFCTSAPPFRARSSSSLNSLSSFSTNSTRAVIRASLSESFSLASFAHSRPTNSASMWKASTCCLRSEVFSRLTSRTYASPSFKAWAKFGSEALAVKQRKCKVETAPVLKVASWFRDSMANPFKTMASSSTPWFMKLPTFSTIPSSSRSSFEFCACPEAQSMAVHLLSKLS